MLASVVRAASRSTPSPLRRVLTSQTRYSSTSPLANEENDSSTSSTIENQTSSPQVYLTPERKRKLIKIYHQAEHFVNPENLSQYIDEEFRRALSSGDALREEDRRATAIEELMERRSSRKTVSLSTSSDNTLGRFQRTVGDSKIQRKERRVKAALFGLDDSDVNEPKAGVETIEKSHEVPDALKEEESR